MKSLLMRLVDLIRQEPVAFYSLVGAAIGLAVAFGLPISPELKAAILLFAGAGLAIITRSQVSPVSSLPK